MKRTRTIWSITLLVMLGLIAPSLAMAGAVLDGVKVRKQLRCGVRDNVAGFAERNADGKWQGLDVDFCRAVAAAVIGDPEKVEFTPLEAAERFPALQARQIDLLLGNTTWTFAREATLKLVFPGILFYDRQGFLVPTAAGIASIADLQGKVLCLEKGTTHQRHVPRYLESRSIKAETLVLDSMAEASAAFFAGRCQAYVSDISKLAGIRIKAPNNTRPEDFTILSEHIAEEPLSAVIWTGDPEWNTVIRWVLNALILAEQRGITRANLNDTLAKSKGNLILGMGPLETHDTVAKFLGIEPRWEVRAIQAAGNYGEMYERNLGSNSPLKIERGMNRIWTEGGLHYAPPID